jgi:hypothetical protein
MGSKDFETKKKRKTLKKISIKNKDRTRDFNAVNFFKKEKCKKLSSL